MTQHFIRYFMAFFPQLSQCAIQGFDCMKYDHVGSQATNMLIFYNVEVMTRVLKELKEEGHNITEEDLKHLSPYIESANRLGDYRLELKKQVRPLDFSISVL